MEFITRARNNCLVDVDTMIVIASERLTTSVALLDVVICFVTTTTVSVAEHLQTILHNIVHKIQTKQGE